MILDIMQFLTKIKVFATYKMVNTQLLEYFELIVYIDERVENAIFWLNA